VAFLYDETAFYDIKTPKGFQMGAQVNGTVNDQIGK
jgi:hypothetical protein